MNSAPTQPRSKAKPCDERQRNALLAAGRGRGSNKQSRAVGRVPAKGLVAESVTSTSCIATLTITRLSGTRFTIQAGQNDLIGLVKEWIVTHERLSVTMDVKLTFNSDV